MTANRHPIRLALIGAGLFARGAHAPSLLQLGDRYRVVVVYSRTYASAAAVAAMFPYPVDVCTDMAATLARDDVEAVDITLPIPLLPDAVRLALAAGKHVISEKPIAPDVMGGRALLDAYKDLLARDHSTQVWMVAENWRYEDAFVQTAELVARGGIGRPIACQWTVLAPMRPDNRYYRTRWRRSGQFPGGLLLDAGVHHVAALRSILGEIQTVTAVATQAAPDLPPAYTLSATLRFTNGALGSYLLSFAVDAPWKNQLHIMGDAGSLRVGLGKIELATDQGETYTACQTRNGVRDELAAFADAIRHQTPHRNSPQEALRDVAVIEAMLLAADAGVSVAPARVVDRAR